MGQPDILHIKRNFSQAFIYILSVGIAVFVFTLYKKGNVPLRDETLESLSSHDEDGNKGVTWKVKQLSCSINAAYDLVEKVWSDIMRDFEG